MSQTPVRSLEDCDWFFETSTCPKCKSDDVSAMYHESGVPIDVCWPYIKDEHIDRRCRRCQFAWLEKVMPARELPPTDEEGSE